MRKPEDVPIPAMYNQIYVDNLLNEIEYYKKLYREYLVKYNKLKVANEFERVPRPGIGDGDYRGRRN